MGKKREKSDNYLDRETFLHEKAAREQAAEAEEQARADRMIRADAQRAYEKAGRPGTLEAFTKQYAAARQGEITQQAMTEARQARQAQKRISKL
jgi:hypothetical protein